MADLKFNIPKSFVWPYRGGLLSQKLLTVPVTLAEGHLNHSSDEERKIWCSHDLMMTMMMMMMMIGWWEPVDGGVSWCFTGGAREASKGRQGTSFHRPWCSAAMLWTLQCCNLQCGDVHCTAHHYWSLEKLSCMGSIALNWDMSIGTVAQWRLVHCYIGTLDIGTVAQWTLDNRNKE